MKVIHIFAFAILFFGLTACKKNLDFPSKDLEQIIGEWEWVEAHGGFAGLTLNPGSEGFTESLLFQNSGEFVRYRDSLETQSYYFWIEEGSSIFINGTAYLLKIGNRDHSTVNFIYSIDLEDDILYLNEECNDCFRYEYSRKP